MRATIRAAAMVSILLSTTSPGFAHHAAKHARRHATPQPTYNMQGPRMIEIRPGWWVSSYECLSEDNYGRFRSCSGGF